MIKRNGSKKGKRKMKKRVYEEWIADDGTVFQNRRDCEKYERKDKKRYRVIYHTILEYSDEILADNEEQAKRIVYQYSPPFDEWAEVSTDVKCIELEDIT